MIRSTKIAKTLLKTESEVQRPNHRAIFFFLFFFAISSLIVLGSMLAKMANSAKTGISFSACLMGFWLPSFLLSTIDYSYLIPSELGGTVRLSERYTPGDCGRDADLERKYAGKKRSKKSRTAHAVEDPHTRAIRNHLRHLGIHGARAASILTGILDPTQALPAASCVRSGDAA